MKDSHYPQVPLINPMKEIHEFRIFRDDHRFLPQPNNAKFNGSVYVLKIFSDDPLFQKIGELARKFRKNNDCLFSSWRVSRIYTKKELTEASLLRFNIKTAFEPVGEQCGTIYDETTACAICGANRRQVGSLKLKKGSIPKKDIARTIAGEVVVSGKFVTACRQRSLIGAVFEPIVFDKGTSGYYQLIVSSPQLELTKETVVGHNPFDLSTDDAEADEFIISGGYKVKFEKTVFKCPKGHTIGARLLSEPYVFAIPSIKDYDFFVSKQKVGAKQGLLRAEPLYFCSQAFRRMVEEEKLSGFGFEVARLAAVDAENPMR
jgi:hypothetical protein